MADDGGKDAATGGATNAGGNDGASGGNTNQSATDPDRLFGDPVPPDQPEPDKSQYNIFNPVPDDQMRSFSTDRPGKTHSSTTVDAGHFQVESDIVNYTFDHYSPNDATTQFLAVGTPILKAGLTNWADIEIGLNVYDFSHVTQRATATTVRADGFGDTLVGSKINLFGNEGEQQSLAILPFVKIPTAARNVGNGVPEYMLDVPYTIALDTLWSLTAETDLALLKNDYNTAHHGDYSFIVNVNRPVFWKDVTASLEFASEYASQDAMPRYTLDPAVQWVVVDNFQLDMGIYVGLNRAAADYNPYVGVSYRY